MPKDSIAIIEVHRANAGSTVLAVVLTTAAIVIGAVLVFDITLVTTVRN